ncbi:hypothetical protein SAMN04489752_2935 [Brevibacterium siliguriense]|uniref:Uncharacterized protein n=1 Tax=Brevibacterium siliguriense TaxID=1136497 RepID=A0A1H1WC70_9MICO|nr:hypothetical protein [Brevibacterium siliguriense]SDS94918.1 hypothetical protein SAMN04489752_2935 [Brevibacterium siliguriense]
MPFLLLSPSQAPQPIASVDDDLVRTQHGPAVIITATEAAASLTSTDDSTATGFPPEGRPVAFREAGGDWTEVGFEVADHWMQMGPGLHIRLAEDHLATFDVAEFKQATNGGSASIITNNWVYSGQPRIYRVAGQLRDFVTVLGQLSRP